MLHQPGSKTVSHSHYISPFSLKPNSRHVKASACSKLSIISNGYNEIDIT